MLLTGSNIALNYAHKVLPGMLVSLGMDYNGFIVTDIVRNGESTILTGTDAVGEIVVEIDEPMHVWCAKYGPVDPNGSGFIY